MTLTHTRERHPGTRANWRANILAYKFTRVHFETPRLSSCNSSVSVGWAVVGRPPVCRMSAISAHAPAVAPTARRKRGSDRRAEISDRNDAVPDALPESLQTGIPKGRTKAVVLRCGLPSASSRCPKSIQGRRSPVPRRGESISPAFANPQRSAKPPFRSGPITAASRPLRPAPVDEAALKSVSQADIWSR